MGYTTPRGILNPNWRGGLVERMCQLCGVMFHVKPHKVREGKARFCCRSHAATACLTGKKSHAWKGGRHNFSGYVAVHAPGHPNASVQGGQYALEHRLVAVRALGRPLSRREVVHHVNGDMADNRNCNLVICTQGYHRLLHAAMRRKAVA